MQWDPRFFERSLVFEPYARCAAALAGNPAWPARAALDALLRASGVTNASGRSLRATAAQDAGGVSYERRIFDAGELEVREGDWHDLMNVLVWCAFPRTKAALNARHVAAAAAERAGNRGRVRDALTLFDESGAIVVASDAALLDDLRGFRWKRLFWEHRERVRASLRVYAFGHALLEKALAPYIGMTAQAVTLAVGAEFLDKPGEIDARTAECVGDALHTPRDLAPLPMLGVPGWWPANEEERFYEDTSYFRPGRRRR